MRAASGYSTSHLGPLSSDTSCELDVFGHDGYPFGVDGTEIGVLEQTNEVGFSCLLESHDRRGLETQVGLEVLSDLADQSLEGQLANEQLS